MVAGIELLLVGNEPQTTDRIVIVDRIIRIFSEFLVQIDG
jgi:hypothetical protein